MFGNIFIILGAFLLLVSVIGIHRFDDFFSKIHPAGVIDSLGCSIIILGIIFKVNSIFIAMKLVLLILFLMITNPTSTHLLAKIYYNNNKDEIEKIYDFKQEK